jgi:hypothetical protein
MNATGKDMMNIIWKVTLDAVAAFSILIGFPAATHAGPDEVPVGLWGGEHISMEVTERGARVEYDCAHGTIDERIVTDRRGRFNVRGTYVEEHGGPVREKERLNSYPVRFTGRIRGKKMEVTVTRSDTKKTIGSFTLVHGQEPSLVKCR